MAKINVVSISPDGKTKYTSTIDDSELDAMKAKAESKGFSFRILDPLSPAEEARVMPTVEAESSRKEALFGGLLQGVSLGTEDILGSDTESKRLRQEAEHPYIYGAGKFIGSLVPGAAAAIGGAKAGGSAGAAIGALGGPAGAAAGAGIGAVAGGMLGAGTAGALESYASKETPPEGKGLPSGSDIAMGLISGATEGIGAKVAPLARNAWRAARDKLIGREMVKGATELAEISAEEIAKKLNIFKRARSILASNKKFAESDSLLKATDEDIVAELDVADAQDMLALKRELEKGLDIAGGTNIARADSVIEILENQLKDAQGTVRGALSSPVIGGAASAIPMAVPDVDINEEKRKALQRQAIERAYYEAQRSKFGSAKQ
jgi:hypothetical protein